MHELLQSGNCGPVFLHFRLCCFCNQGGLGEAVFQLMVQKPSERLLALGLTMGSGWLQRRKHSWRESPTLGEEQLQIWWAMNSALQLFAGAKLWMVFLEPSWKRSQETDEFSSAWINHRDFGTSRRIAKKPQSQRAVADSNFKWTKLITTQILYHYDKMTAVLNEDWGSFLGDWKRAQSTLWGSYCWG